jgi:hypothetical protein
LIFLEKSKKSKFYAWKALKNQRKSKIRRVLIWREPPPPIEIKPLFNEFFDIVLNQTLHSPPIFF